MQSNRQVDVILQNNTQELLTVESCQTIFGSWAQSYAPRIGTAITKQGSGKWSTVSDFDDYQVGAYVRLGSTKGYIDIEWILPKNAAEFQHSVQVPVDLRRQIRFVMASASYRVMVITLLPAELIAELDAMPG
ncbi:hypothetical protein D3877_23955 [Azospirillum cavernae]|uniref:Uncharacterized protein n=1 Tax=Azospirillum cavernae TaxID=2320860 RepID=A0A418VPI2_9PROT|nr:hypothetical protein [Azospirillum cavernae]RJF78175.1 hypothetical protein D3877_23955 [Azospirillum cavernae]